MYFSLINQILIYSARNSNRLYYIIRTLLYDGLGLDFRICEDAAEFKSHRGPRLSYAQTAEDGVLNIKPHSILYDHGIRDYHLEVMAHDRFFRIFFRNQDDTIPFDLFGASFWLLSRYEEYLPFKADQFNRFQFTSSLAYQYDFLHLPLVNLWLTELKTLLKEKYPDLRIRERAYNFVSTIDVDNAYKYKYKGFVRTLAGIVNDHKISKIRQRFRILLNKARDPFDSYDFVIRAHRDKDVQSIFFFLLGDYGPNDKNHSASDLRFQALIKHVADYAKVGVHPSFGSNSSLRQLKVEVSRLSNITHRIIEDSRQHFSVLKFPKTYLDLIQAGITCDYSMGYTNKNGFRASYCYPYKWYMLETESVSQLELHPFCLSENTLLFQAEQEQTEPMKLAMPFIREVRTYGGQMIPVFHNDSFTQRMKQFYLEFLDQAAGPA
ncbi:MAG TPA: polysaccharide deacetylase family protein [Bacteroidia bacterium]|nr:polysaccharide deacetylase family protein [Bacteroidia bacterium]